MKIMLTSFGIQHSVAPTDRSTTMFHRMPPVSFRWINQSFMPDYGLLLLCDSVVMDEASFDRLRHGVVRAYSTVAETFQALRSEGRIELVDFSSVLAPHTELLSRMIDYDIKLLDQWVGPLRESLTLWGHFSKMSMEIMHAEKERRYAHAALRALSPYQRGFNPHQDSVIFHEVGHLLHSAGAEAAHISMMVERALRSSVKRKRKEYRSALRDVLRGYLAYVDANLILANQLDVGFHDWLDFTPFYATKFLSVGKDGSEVEQERAQLEQLFTVPFPDLAIQDTRSLMKALNDRRLDELRSLVADAANGHVTFDDEFAKSVLREVFKESESARRWRSVLGYATLPIGLIPLIGTPVQKALEVAIGVPMEKKLKKKHRWFYMLSDIARSKKGEPNNRTDTDGK